MKRKIFGIVGIMLVALLLLAGCGAKDNNTASKDAKSSPTKKASGPKEDLVYEDTSHGYKTTFKYSKDDFRVTKEEVSSVTGLNEMYLEDKDLDINVRLSYTIYNYAKAYSSIKSGKKSLPSYKEYTWNGIEGFMYGLGDNYITFMIPLELNDSNELVLTVLVTPIKDSKSSVIKAAQGEVVQDFLKSITYSKN